MLQMKLRELMGDMYNELKRKFEKTFAANSDSKNEVTYRKKNII